MRSDEELRRALARPDLPWPDETGAYERFLRRQARHGRVMATTAGLALVAVLGAAVLVARQLPQEPAPAPPATAAEPTPRPYQWVYEKELRVEDGSRKPWTWERWVRVDGKKTAILDKARETKAEATEMMKTYLGEDADALDGFEFLTMAEAGEVGHWSVLRKLNERARRDDVQRLVDWALPIQERHFQAVLDGSLELAAQEDPNEPS